MNTNTLTWRKRTARVLVSAASPIIDDYLSVACGMPIYAKLSPIEIVEETAPQFVEIILTADEPTWPDFYDLLLAEVKYQMIKRLTRKSRLKNNLK